MVVNPWPTFVQKKPKNSKNGKHKIIDFGLFGIFAGKYMSQSRESKDVVDDSMAALKAFHPSASNSHVKAALRT